MGAHEKLFEDRNIDFYIIIEDILVASRQQRFEFLETMLHLEYCTVDFCDENESCIKKITFDTNEHMAKAKKLMENANVVYEPYSSPSKSKTKKKTKKTQR
ncbi:hypothetical protein Hdeb2414_s0556g00916071 [Helianthus debilis subsp. tardiflorus]